MPSRWGRRRPCRGRLVSLERRFAHRMRCTPLAEKARRPISTHHTTPTPPNTHPPTPDTLLPPRCPRPGGLGSRDLLLGPFAPAREGEGGLVPRIFYSRRPSTCAFDAHPPPRPPLSTPHREAQQQSIHRSRRGVEIVVFVVLPSPHPQAQSLHPCWAVLPALRPAAPPPRPPRPASAGRPWPVAMTVGEEDGMPRSARMALRPRRPDGNAWGSLSWGACSWPSSR